MGTTREVGAVIRARRAELGFSQAEAARAAGVSRQWLSGVESGKATAEIGRILAVLDVLDLDLIPQPRKAQPATPPVRPAPAPEVDLDDLLENYRRR